MLTDQEANFRQIALHQAAHDHRGMSPAVKVVEDAKTYYAFLRADDADLRSGQKPTD